jgi:2-C-methyl-D-erythritol 4-phosphate cytidylyltransferase
VAVALIVAAGRGERLGTGRPKALITLSGRPMLQWSVDALHEVEAVRRTVVALPPDALDAAPAGTVAVAGGTVRSDSVRCALAAAGDGDPVIVHDAARPLASPALFARALAALEATGADAVVAALPVSDTIKEVAPGSSAVLRTLERPRLWAVQTPQVFRRAALERALWEASPEVLAAATDDAWLVERGGGSVHVVEGEATNLKVTVPADLQIAERLLAERAALPARAP